MERKALILGTNNCDEFGFGVEDVKAEANCHPWTCE